ncbi:MAG: hypothetical protein U0792_15605 [Gemmataceae bacterium]
MRRIIVVAALAIVFSGNERAEANWLRGSHTTPPTVLNGTAGRGSWAGVPGIGAPLPASRTKSGTHPVVGSVSRTGHFVHPITGRTRYSGTAYDPTLAA